MEAGVGRYFTIIRNKRLKNVTNLTIIFECSPNPQGLLRPHPTLLPGPNIPSPGETLKWRP
jgi:hypothetical protein